MGDQGGAHMLSTQRFHWPMTPSCAAGEGRPVLDMRRQVVRVLTRATTYLKSASAWFLRSMTSTMWRPTPIIAEVVRAA